MPRLLALATLFATSFACASLTGESFYCAREVDGETEACIDVFDVEQGLVGAAMRVSLNNLCVIVGSKPTAGTCPTDGVVAGCLGDEQDRYSTIEWSYASDEVVTPDDVSCGSDEVKVGPDREPIEAETVDTDTDV